MSDLALIIALIFGGQIIGAFAGVIWKPRGWMVCGSLAFAASVMLGISLLQLIPESVALVGVPLAAVSFLAGALIMWLASLWFRGFFHGGKRGALRPDEAMPLLVGGIALHNVPEGLAMGAAFALRPAFGLAMAIALFLHDIPENLAVAVPVYGVLKRRGKAFIIVTATILFELAGFLAGYFLLRGANNAPLGAALSLAAGLMTYISLAELIPTSRTVCSERQFVMSMVGGLILVLLLGSISF